MLLNKQPNQPKVIKNELNSMPLKFNGENLQKSRQIQKCHQKESGSQSNIVPIAVPGNLHNDTSTLRRKKALVNKKSYKSMTITLTLLHPSKLIPIQNWRFEKALNIWIGRSAKNHVVVRSCVVSRHHVELRQLDGKWILTSFGSNGTYVNGQQISQVCLEDGAIVHLGRTGPAIQIHLTAAKTTEDPLETELQCVS